MFYSQVRRPWLTFDLAHRLDTVEVMDRVASLLQDSPCLVVGFNAFLPQEYHLELSGDGKLITVKTPSETETIGDYSALHTLKLFLRSFHLLQSDAQK